MRVQGVAAKPATRCRIIFQKGCRNNPGERNPALGQCMEDRACHRFLRTPRGGAKKRTCFRSGKSPMVVGSTRKRMGAGAVERARLESVCTS